MSLEESRPAGDADGETADRIEELTAQVEFLAEQNRQLRQEYARVRRTEYRRTAAGLAGVGLLVGLGGLVFPAGRSVLFTLAATGLFGAVLTYYLTPEQFVSASAGETLYGTYADNVEAMVETLGLEEVRLYVPTDDDRVDAPACWLFVPQHGGYEIPSADALATPFVATDDELARGLSLRPSGAAFFRAFETALTGPLQSDPGGLANQLADGVVEQFEFAAAVDPSVDSDANRISFGIEDPAFGSVDRVDHPIPSFLAVGVARGRSEPVEVRTVAPGGDRPALVTCTWGAEDRAAGRAE